MQDKPNPVSLVRILEERDRLRDELTRARMSAAKWKYLAQKARQQTADAKPQEREQPQTC